MRGSHCASVSTASRCAKSPPPWVCGWGRESTRSGAAAAAPSTLASTRNAKLVDATKVNNLRPRRFNGLPEIKRARPGRRKKPPRNRERDGNPTLAARWPTAACIAAVWLRRGCGRVGEGGLEEVASANGGPPHVLLSGPVGCSARFWSAH